VPAFISAVTTPWTTKSLLSAVSSLTEVLVAEVKKFDQSRGTYTVVEPIELPLTATVQYNIGVRKHDRIDNGAIFVRGRLYETWNRSLFPAASFDAYSTEYKLAELVDKSGTVAWWKRLVDSDKAKIAYTVRDNYYPDFVVNDSTDDVHWIVEAKAANKKSDENVQVKKKATEELVKTLLGDERFTETRWGYFIAYEDDIAAADSWTELKQRCDLVGKPQ
jgi:type III restriction enzyme